MILRESGAALKGLIGRGIAFTRNVGVPILFLAVGLISCTTGRFRGHSDLSSGADHLSFFSPAIFGNMNSVAVSYYALIIERALGTGKGDFEIDISGCGRLDSLLALDSFLAEKSRYNDISPAIDSINVMTYQGNHLVGKIEMREFAASFIGRVGNLDCDTLVAEGNISAMGGEYELFGERMRVRQGSMRFSSTLCDRCERVLTILSERTRPGDSKSAGSRMKIYSRMASEDALDLHFSTDYSYLVSDMEIAFSGGTMVAEFMTYTLLDSSFDADSAFSVASIFLTIDLRRGKISETRQDCVTLTFDPQMNPISTDISLIELLQ